MKSSISRVLAAAALLLVSVAALAQTHNVSGTVVDASDGQPIIGAGVTLSTGGGTVTDYDGKYVISAPENAVITFSSLGYKSTEQKVGSQTVINVSLMPDTEALEEVVVLGYTTQKKAELSSAVVSIAGEKLTDVTTPDVGNMLQGKVAGVMVMNSSGQPGAGADIRIRGTGSINAGAGPLYVVDGVAGGSFNPNDVETLTVLKDASATALYGAAASGGVIVITTKGAKSDKATVNFKASVGAKRALHGRFKAMDAYELYDLYSKIYTKSQLKGNAPKQEDLANYNYDWVGNTYKTGLVQNYYASVSGKAGKVGYYASIDHYNEKGSLINTAYMRNSARINLNAPITDRLTMNVRVSYTKDNTLGGNWFTRENAYVMEPFDIPYVMDADGNYTTEPLQVTNSKRSDNKKKWYSAVTENYFHNELYNYEKSHGETLVGDLQLVWNVTDWLTLTSTNRYDTSNSFSESYSDKRTTAGAPDGSLSNSDSEWNGWGTTNLAKFHKTFGDHDVNAIIGWEYSEGYSRSMGVSGNSMPAGQRAISNTVNWIGTGSDYHTRTWALLSQAQYSYLGKYIVTASIRYDQSYKFGPLNRGGFFPGVSGAWVISNENFMKNQSVVDFLKLRAGFGMTGNDNIPTFQYQDTFSLSANYNNVVAAFLERQANYKLGWEQAYMASLGVDATLLKDRLNVTLDLYHTINDRLLLENPKSPSTGFFSVMDNTGKVRNMGVELAVDGTIIKAGDFIWDAGFNLGFNQNRVLEYPEHEKVITKAEVQQKIMEGHDIYSWYMKKWVGVDAETGKPLWEEIVDNGDGTTTVNYTSNYNNATDQIVGSATPWFTGGVNTSLSWKGVTLSATGSFIVGNKIYNRTRQHTMDTDGAKGGYNQQSFDNGLGWVRWDPDDPSTHAIATHPQPSEKGNNSANELSSRYLEDGSFFRLRNVTLSYDLPKKLMSKIRIGGIRVYVSADNLLTLTRFSGMDPEVNLEMSTWSVPGVYADNYPVPMSIVGGIDIKF